MRSSRRRSINRRLRNYAWVARQVPLSRRRDSLSFGYHAEVAALAQAEQDFWLRKAEELSWPVRQLRQEVRASIRERHAGKTSARGEDGGAGQAPPARSEERAVARLQIRVPGGNWKAARTPAGERAS
jgi:hypothetical protein